MKTITATTPPITAWSTPEEVDMAVGSGEEGRGMERREEERRESYCKDEKMGVKIREREGENERATENKVETVRKKGERQTEIESREG